MARPIQTRFLIISDTHDIDISRYTESHSTPDINGCNKHDHKPFPAVDVVLHCGDFTENGGFHSRWSAIRGLAGTDAELKLVIPGNHDIELDEAFFEK